MKNLLCVLLVLVVLFSLHHCEGLPDHSIRVKNLYQYALEVKIGKVNFGTVGSGVTTKYKDIEEGTHKLGGDLQGSVTIEGNGIHKWTMTIKSDGGATIEED